MIFFKQMLAILKNSCTFATAFRGVQKLMNLMEQASFAEIAQLVEHDLAKVGVASSSLVFRSKVARMVESVDTRDLKSLGHYGCAGSSPASSTKKIAIIRQRNGCDFYFIR